MIDNPYRVAELLGLALPSSAWRQAGAGGMEAAISAGFPKAALYSLAKLLESDPVRVNELAHSVVPKSTLSRRTTLTPQQSERTERLARIFVRAEEVLGSAEDARAFVHREHPELGGRNPLNAATTELGARHVERLLDSLEFGLPV